MKRIDITGQTFGRLTVLEYIGMGSSGTRYLCKCSCGNEKIINAKTMKNGGTRSCGCLFHSTENPKFKHGKSRTPEYKTWLQMNYRCHDPKCHAYPNYGGRGITVCEEWKIFENFLKDMGKRPEGLSIERKDNNKGYCKENCIWADDKTQMNNRECTFMIEWKGQRRPFAVICGELGINYNTAYARYTDGKSLDYIFDTNKHSLFRENNPRAKMITYLHRTQTISDWAREYSIETQTLAYRLKSGWSIAEALNVKVDQKNKLKNIRKLFPVSLSQEFLLPSSNTPTISDTWIL